jgi:hypothetical protein
MSPTHCGLPIAGIQDLEAEIQNPDVILKARQGLSGDMFGIDREDLPAHLPCAFGVPQPLKT